MAKKSTSTTLTKKYVSATDQQSSKSTKTPSTVLARQSKKLAQMGHWLAGAWVLGAAILTGSDFRLPQTMELHAQSAFYQFRGAIAPPDNIVILAIDDQSISNPQIYYQTDPQKYASLEPLKAFPFKRAAYAQVIDKLMLSGARAVALDVVFDLPSSYGVEDDRKLLAALQRNRSRVTLAALYEQSEANGGSPITQLRQPHSILLNASKFVGSVNFPLEMDGKIHRLAGEFPKELTELEGSLLDKIPDFDTATLRSANIDFPKPTGDRIYFRGGAGTFPTVPFWHVLDPDQWDSNLQSGKIFKDKIVIVGATANLANDFHSVAVNWLFPDRMSGVEIHANAIATLMQGNALTSAIKSASARSLFVLVLVGGGAFFVAKNKNGRIRILFSLALAAIWGGITYTLFIFSQVFFPTAIPVIAMVAIGISYLGTEIAVEKLRKIQLVDILKKNTSSRVVQEIISQQEDLKDLLLQREIQISGKVLDGRYKIVRVLGSGGFSETYIAEDTRLPDNPLCVVKQLQPANNKSEQLQVARRLFASEAQTLQKLGSYDQIPQLLAYFEEGEEFYLVQEYIIGNALSQELPSGKRINQTDVVNILRDLLQTLTFVHANGVIHRDIKPSNVMRRECDRKLVLIDFGAVKQVSADLVENPEQSAFTIGIGTKGYAPKEQCFGRPQYSSDIYAVGMIGIKALTGIPPHELKQDADGEVTWIHQAEVSLDFGNILNKMVCEDYQERYQTASEVLEALNKLTFYNIKSSSNQDSSLDTLSLEDYDTPTVPWDGTSDEEKEY
jgi:CHASE2 domain-containing sensor protein/tRNA A-37 threonylcarbamoyl transferase component Bud32